MNRRASLAAVALLALTPAETPAQPTPPRTGVTTHFSQGWPQRLIPVAASLGTATIRDSVRWNAVEQTPGRLNFTEANSAHITRACQQGMTVLLGLEPRNHLYDDGNTAYTPQAQSAFARYVAAIADRWPNCVVAIEIGNEINGKNNITGPAAADRITAHVALLKAVHQAVKPRHPNLSLLGGSSNAIPTGFLERLFRAGALQWVDAIAIHPYRQDPEGLDWELARLQSAMARTGRARPIWATEFSRDFPNPNDAPAYYLKTISLLEAADITDHFWYALADQKFFPTMGLVTMAGTSKPAAEAYAFAAHTLAPRGAGRRADEHDATLFHVRFGADAHVIWGARRPLSAAPRAHFFAADGKPVPPRQEVSEDPIVITNSPEVSFGPPEVLADSALGFARPPFAWLALPTAGAPIRLQPIDWQWASYLGSPASPGLVVNPHGIGTSPTASAVVRYTAPQPGPLVASACLVPASTTGGPARATLAYQGKVLWTTVLTPRSPRTVAQIPLTAAAGDSVELVLSPIAGTASLRFRYRFRVTRRAADPASC